MFKIEEKSFGNFIKINLLNSQTKEIVSIIPDFGANVNEIILNKNGINYSILEGYKNQSEMIKNEWFKGAKLIPFPNRINNGKYSFYNKNYQLLKNYPTQNHSIHGFLYDKKFEITEKTQTRKQASIKLEYVYKGGIEGYPFHFKVKINYFLVEKDGFKCTTTIKNTDKTRLPIGDGWHPYFRTIGMIDNLLLKIPSTEKIEVNDRMIPSGKFNSFTKFKSLSKIGIQDLDMGFLIRKKGRIAQTEVYDPKLDLKILIWQETGKMKYNYLQLFIPPSRQSIAIEPMTCSVDAFNNKQGLIILKPNQSLKASYGVRLL